MTDKSNIIGFFNVSQTTNSVRASTGISLESFLSSLLFSIIYCLIQIILYTYLCNSFQSFYDPFCKVHEVNNARRFLRFGKKLFNLDIQSYRELGLEPYFFLRFLCMLLYMFLMLTCVVTPVLVPINFLYGGDLKKGSGNPSDSLNSFPTDSAARGLDLISISNISPLHADKYIFHFLLTILIVTWFYHLCRNEIKYCIEEKNKEIIRQINKEPDKFLVVLVRGVNKSKFRTIASLKQFLNYDNDAVDCIWNIYDYKILEKTVQKYMSFRSRMEKLELQIIRAQNGISSNFSNSLFVDNPLSSLGISIPGISERVNNFNYLCIGLRNCSKKIKSIQYTIFNEELTKGDSMPLSDNVFIKFKTPVAAVLACQFLLTQDQKELNCRIISDTEDINWTSLSIKNDFASKMRNFFVFCLYSITIILWVIPVAMAGSISQLPYLTALIPTIRWINKLPSMIKGFIAGILPTIILAFLTGIAMNIFRWLSHKKYLLTKSESELHLQQWTFSFLHFHLFIVITISSGLVVVLENLVYRPTTVPSIIAKDLPRASNFFFSFFIYRGLTLFGNGLLQFYRFITQGLIYPRLFDTTPREKYERLLSYQNLDPCLGQTYPTFSVYASIGIVYSVISPLVLVFCCINFLLDLMAFKYLLSYSFSRRQLTETYGQLYPMAWRQLFAGIYCLEIFLMGLLFVVKDSDGKSACSIMGILMIILLLTTIWAHIKINTEFERSIDTIPYECLVNLQRDTNAMKDSQSKRKDFLHPYFSFQPDDEPVWIPQDTASSFIEESNRLHQHGISVICKGCSMDHKGHIHIDK